MAHTNGDLLWWISRGTGIAALVALSAGLALGVATVPRLGRPGYTVAGLHRALSVAGLTLTVVHVAAIVTDSYAPVGWLDGVLPFASAYRRWWTGIGTVAFDLMLAAAVTSQHRLRHRYALWRGVHLTSWLCWPLAVGHGLADGTDTKAVWVFVLTLVCVALVAAALGWRVSHGPVSTGIFAAVTVALCAALTLAGPARAGWAARAGTPSGLDGGGVTGGSSGDRSAAQATTWRAGLQARLASGLPVGGRLQELRVPGNTQRAREVFTAALPDGSLTVVLEGKAYETGLNIDQSAVTLGPVQAPDAYRGVIAQPGPRGHAIEVSGPGGRWPLWLQIRSQSAVAWTGELSAG